MTQAMRSFAGWASGRPYRLILLTILFVQLLAPVAGGLLVLDALRNGPAAALRSALIALGGIGIGGLALGENLATTLGFAAPVLLGSLVSGVMLGATRSLSLAFQATVVGSLVMTLLIFGLLPGVEGLGPYLLSQTMAVMESLSFSADRIAEFAATPPGWMVQILLTTLLVSILSGLMLGYWWFALAGESGRFGRDFRALRLGRFAGALLTGLVVLPLLLPVEAVEFAAQLAVIGFLFQGLAVMHARSRSDQWHKAVVVLIYVALLSFSLLSLLALAGLSVVGLLDNFFALRGRARPEA